MKILVELCITYCEKYTKRVNKNNNVDMAEI